jgi:hypothetical protein
MPYLEGVVRSQNQNYSNLASDDIMVRKVMREEKLWP